MPTCLHRASTAAGRVAGRQRLGDQGVHSLISKHQPETRFLLVSVALLVPLQAERTRRPYSTVSEWISHYWTRVTAVDARAGALLAISAYPGCASAWEKQVTRDNRNRAGCSPSLSGGRTSRPPPTAGVLRPPSGAPSLGRKSCPEDADTRTERRKARHGKEKGCPGTFLRKGPCPDTGATGASAEREKAVFPPARGSRPLRLRCADSGSVRLREAF